MRGKFKLPVGQRHAPGAPHGVEADERAVLVEDDELGLEEGLVQPRFPRRRRGTRDAVVRPELRPLDQRSCWGNIRVSSSIPCNLDFRKFQLPAQGQPAYFPIECLSNIA